MSDEATVIRFPFLLRDGDRYWRAPAARIEREEPVPPGVERMAPEYHANWLGKYGAMIRCGSRTSVTVKRGIGKDWRSHDERQAIQGMRKLPEEVAAEAERYDAQIAEVQKVLASLIRERDELLDVAWPRCEMVRIGDVEAVETRLARDRARKTQGDPT